MLTENDYIIVFATHNQAVFLFNKLLRMGYGVELISTPCRISAGCTQSIKFKYNLMDVVKQEAENRNMMIRGIYKVVKQGTKFNYIKV